MIELPLKRPFSDSYVDGGENSGGQLATVYLHSKRTHEPPRDTVTMVNRRLRRPYPFTEINLSPDHSACKGELGASVGSCLHLMTDMNHFILLVGIQIVV